MAIFKRGCRLERELNQYMGQAVLPRNCQLMVQKLRIDGPRFLFVQKTVFNR